jgi:transposase
MAKSKRMDQIKAILRNYHHSKSIKATARQLLVSKNTVRDYLRRAFAYTADIQQLLDMEDSLLDQILNPIDSFEKQKERLLDFESQVAGWVQDLKKVGVTRQLLWEQYRKSNPDGYGYSQFCEHLKAYVARHDLTLALEHQPGEVMMVDFAGKKMHWIDESSGEVHDCEILVAVFPCTQYCFCIALPSQRLPDFIDGLNQSLLYFKGLPRVILSDNLKAYVSKPDRYEPKFTQLCEQLGEHYQIELQATRVGKPKDKASVENAVLQIYRSIYAPLRNRVFHSLMALNEDICHQLSILNNRPYQQKEGSRITLFDRYERPLIRPLPADIFEIKKITQAKVQRNYHIMLGDEKNFYSVPWQYVGKKVEVLYTTKHVEIYLESRRIAIHSRTLVGKQQYRYITKEEHMPQHHVEWKQSQGYDATYFLKKAQAIGPHTRWAMQQVLLSRVMESQTYNSCKGILNLGLIYTDQRLEQAARRCQQSNKATYTMLKLILERKLDRVVEEPPAQSLGFHENIRGAEYYQ